MTCGAVPPQVTNKLLLLKLLLLKLLNTSWPSTILVALHDHQLQHMPARLAALAPQPGCQHLLRCCPLLLHSFAHCLVVLPARQLALPAAEVRSSAAGTPARLATH
jgi:hypothetical protein